MISDTMDFHGCRENVLFKFEPSKDSEKIRNLQS